MLLYRLAVGTLRAVSPLLSRGSSKLARGMAGRRRAHELLAAWGSTLRDPQRPVVWFHAPSVGEGLQADAVIRALRAARPDVQIVYTFFSPSAEGLARRIAPDVAAYLPWDLQGPCDSVLDAIRPDALVFTKTEVWPVLTERAVRRGVPVGIVAATVPAGAGRMRRPARALLRSTWRRLRFAGAVRESDASRLRSLGVPEEAVEVTGDPGIDSAAGRFAEADPDAPWLRPFRARDRPTLVAGSTWPSDEAVLLPALYEVRRRIPDVRAVLAPHEPDEGHVATLLEVLREDGWITETLSSVQESGSAESVDAVVVDSVGVLAQLYGIADASYVGGGFHDAGLHSVLEPAAAGTPVLFGPRHGNAPAAGELVLAGGAEIAGTSEEMTAVLGEWLANPEESRIIGTSARAYIDSHLGAASRTADLLLNLIGPPGPSPDPT